MILELGPGIHRSGDTDIAIDKSPDAQAEIIRDFAKRGIPFNENYFDEVRCYDVIEHIEDYEDLIFLFNEIYRVLKPNGIFHFTTPDGILIGLDHLTHHRAFTQGSFHYLTDDGRAEFNFMRKSDGIECNFRLEFISRKGQIEGKFYAVK